MSETARPEPVVPAPAAPEVARLNGLSDHALVQALLPCCPCEEWAEATVARRPYADGTALLAAADVAWTGVSRDGWLRAFEGSGVAEVPAGDEGTRAGIGMALRLYRERFGFPFILVGDRIGADELLMRVRIRLGLEPAANLRSSMWEQRRHTQAALRRLLERERSAFQVTAAAPLP